MRRPHDRMTGEKALGLEPEPLNDESHTPICRLLRQVYDHMKDEKEEKAAALKKKKKKTESKKVKNEDEEGDEECDEDEEEEDEDEECDEVCLGAGPSFLCAAPTTAKSVRRCHGCCHAYRGPGPRSLF